MKKFIGKKCFITGAASGIGRATAIDMSKLRAELFLTDINEKGLEKTVQIITDQGGKVNMYKAIDISNYEAVRSFADEIHSEFGAMDIIMNIAGISIWGQIEDLKHEHWQKVINVDLWGVIHGIECFLSEMIRAGKGGHMITISSSAGLFGLPWHAPYSAAKWGIIGINEVLRYDLRKHNIDITVVCPGAVETPLKETVEIIGIDTSDPEVNEKVGELRAKFSEHAVTPERVSELIIKKGLKKKKYMVLTSIDMKVLLWSKKHFSPLYNFIMKKLNKMVSDVKEAYEK